MDRCVFLTPEKISGGRQHKGNILEKRSLLQMSWRRIRQEWKNVHSRTSVTKGPYDVWVISRAEEIHRARNCDRASFVVTGETSHPLLVPRGYSGFKGCQSIQNSIFKQLVFIKKNHLASLGVLAIGWFRQRETGRCEWYLCNFSEQHLPQVCQVPYHGIVVKKMGAGIPCWASEGPKVQCWKPGLGSLKCSSALRSWVSFEPASVVSLPDFCEPDLRVQLTNHTQAMPGRTVTVLVFTSFKILSK